jgi:hypothetical protein
VSGRKRIRELTFGAGGGGWLIKSNRLGVNLPLTKHGRAQIMGNANEPPNLKPNYAKIRQFIALYHAAAAVVAARKVESCQP